jgi:hypothetical protein
LSEPLPPVLAESLKTADPTNTGVPPLVVDPVLEPVEEPVVAPVEDPVLEPVEEPVVAPVEDPVLEPVEEPVVAPVEDPVLEPVVDPAVAPPVEASSVSTRSVVALPARCSVGNTQTSTVLVPLCKMLPRMAVDCGVLALTLPRWTVASPAVTT